MFVYPVVLVLTDKKPSSPIALHKIYFRDTQGVPLFEKVTQMKRNTLCNMCYRKLQLQDKNTTEKRKKNIIKNGDYNVLFSYLIWHSDNAWAMRDHQWHKN